VRTRNAHPSPRISKSSGAVSTCRQPACSPTSSGESSPSVRVPGRVVRGRSCVGRWQPYSRRCAHRHLPSRCARALRRVRRWAARRGGRVRTGNAHAAPEGVQLINRNHAAIQAEVGRSHPGPRRCRSAGKTARISARRRPALWENAPPHRRACRQPPSRCAHVVTARSPMSGASGLLSA
jgi:hypothetical protein